MYKPEIVVSCKMWNFEVVMIHAVVMYELLNIYYFPSLLSQTTQTLFIHSTKEF